MLMNFTEIFDITADKNAIIILEIKKYFKDLYKSLGIYLPLITTNCAVFGIILTNIKADYDLITAVSTF